MAAGQLVQIIDNNLYSPLAVEQRIVRSSYKKGFENIAVDLTETVQADGEETHQSPIDQTCL